MVFLCRPSPFPKKEIVRGTSLSGLTLDPLSLTWRRKACPVRTNRLGCHPGLHLSGQVPDWPVRMALPDWPVRMALPDWSRPDGQPGRPLASLSKGELFPKFKIFLVRLLNSLYPFSSVFRCPYPAITLRSSACK